MNIVRNGYYHKYCTIEKINNAANWIVVAKKWKRMLNALKEFLFETEPP